jgi:hypothetical protein
MYNKNYLKNKLVVFTAVLMMTTSMLALIENAQADEQIIIPCDFDLDTSPYQTSNGATPTGDSYLLYIAHSDICDEWYDAEKTVEDTDDNLMCWAAAASNVLRWTGWGYVVHSTEGDMTDEDEMFEHFNDHWEDQGGLSYIGWEWWFEATVPADYPNDPPWGGGPPEWSEVDVAGGGDFWEPAYDWNNWVHTDLWTSDEMERIDEYLHNGWGVALGIYNGGHAITCWGFNYDPLVDKTTNPEDYYLGIWVTDSDDDKENTAGGYPDSIRYYEVEYSGGHWYIQDYYETSDWYIDYVFGLEPFPNTAPTAVPGGPYSGVEGTPVSFDGSGSSDSDGNPLQYRWDFDNNGMYDTGWSSSPTATHTYDDDFSGYVKLQVSDYMDTHSDTVSVEIINEAPDITAYDTSILENEFATLVVEIDDPSPDDTFTATIQWGDGSPIETYPISAGETIFSANHQYPDDNPTGTSQDDYWVSVTIQDDDLGEDTDTAIVTVYNVPPTAYAGSDQTIDEGQTAIFSGSYTDPGPEDTHIFDWNCAYFGHIASTLATTKVYGDDGVLTVYFTVTDDDTGTHTDQTLVIVNNLDPTVNPITMTHDFTATNPQFILPGHVLTFSAFATDPGSDDLTFTWNWGDSPVVTTSTYYNDGMAPDFLPSPDINPPAVTDTATHSYAAPDTYTVTLTVEDDDGGVVTTTYEVIVLDVAGAKHDINDYIQGLPDSDDVFKGKPSKRKNAFDNMFNALDDMLEDEEYWGMIQHLNSNIRSKCDGEGNNDWIIDEDARSHICSKIDALTEYLYTFL